MCSEDSESFLRNLWNMDLFYLQELVYVVFVNKANQAITYRCMHAGTCDSVLIDVKLLIGIIGAVQPSKILLAHNHPGGRAKPSIADINITRKIASACRLVDVEVMDHIILTENGYYSFKDNRLLEEV